MYWDLESYTITDIVFARTNNTLAKYLLITDCGQFESTLLKSVNDFLPEPASSN